MDNEIWKEIPGYEGLYQVSTCGRVAMYERIYKNGVLYKARIKKLCLNDSGYYLTVLSDSSGYKRNYRVSRLVALAFLPNPENKREVNHINGNPKDNRVDNLEWVTPSENIKHAYRTGLISLRAGEKCKHAKLTNSDVLKIRELFNNSTLKYREISQMFNISMSVIGNIKARRIWKHV